MIDEMRQVENNNYNNLAESRVASHTLATTYFDTKSSITCTPGRVQHDNQSLGSRHLAN